MKKDKEDKHDCPEKMVFSNKAGKCINPRLEDESLNEYNDDPTDRSKTPTKSLRFSTTKGRGKKGSGTHHS